MSGGGAGPVPAHLPVMFAEVMEGLAVKADGTYLDGTFGRGGHARGVLQRLGPGGRLLVMDKDPEAICFCGGLVDAFHLKFQAYHSSLSSYNPFSFFI